MNFPSSPNSKITSGSTEDGSRFTVIDVYNLASLPHRSLISVYNTTRVTLRVARVHLRQLILV